MGLTPSDRAVLLKLALEMIDRKCQYAGDEYIGTVTGRRLEQGGYIMRVSTMEADPAGFVFTMLGNAAVGELSRMIHKVTGIGDT